MPQPLLSFSSLSFNIRLSTVSMFFMCFHITYQSKAFPIQALLPIILAFLAYELHP